MPKIETTVPNMLSKDDAKEKLDYMVGKMRKDFADRVQDLESSWTDDTLTLSFTAMSFKIKSDLLVGEDQVDVVTQIPLTAVPFKGMVQSQIVDQLERLLK